MSDKFDPQTHRFGMAYTICGSLFYPYKYQEEHESVSGLVFWNDENEDQQWSHQNNPRSQVIRAPEHDLVPSAHRQAVDVEALKKSDAALDQYNHVGKARVEGWNACIDHLASAGYLAAPQSPATVDGVAHQMMLQQNQAIETLIKNYIEKTGSDINDIQLTIKDEGHGKTSYAIEPKSYRETTPQPSPASDQVSIPQDVVELVAAALDYIADCQPKEHHVTKVSLHALTTLNQYRKGDSDEN